MPNWRILKTTKIAFFKSMFDIYNFDFCAHLQLSGLEIINVKLSIVYCSQKRTKLSYSSPALQFGEALRLVVHLVSYRGSKECT